LPCAGSNLVVLIIRALVQGGLDALDYVLRNFVPVTRFRREHGFAISERDEQEAGDFPWLRAMLTNGFLNEFQQYRSSAWLSRA
jgi:hypothetical protein